MKLLSVTCSALVANVWGLASCERDVSPRPADVNRDRMWGVTIDDISDVPAIVESLRRLGRRPVARVVFDEGVEPGEYASALRAIHPVSGVMGEILDSSAVSDETVSGYLDRTTAYLDALADGVDIWEVGNEINGEWLGDTADVVAKVAGAFDLVKQRGEAVALTLYYNEGCYESADHEMFTWADANLPDRLKQSADYVLVSYYEDDCEGLQPDWQPVFDRLGAMFPRSKIGFGECGTEAEASAPDYVRRYYGMHIDHPRYVGGYFWWYFREHMVPYTRPLWAVLRDAIGP